MDVESPHARSSPAPTSPFRRPVVDSSTRWRKTLRATHHRKPPNSDKGGPVTGRPTGAQTMKRLLILTLGAALTAGACGTSASDATDTSLTAENGAAPAAAAAATPTVAKVAKVATPARPVYRNVTLPAGTTLPLSLTS